MIDDSVSRLGKAVGELRDLVVRHLPTLSLALLPPPSLSIITLLRKR